eukprot:PLAT9775.1.p1 GENE.PLAT9775.1~~PLAT9775.1.p1  ORF type:complete len:191 (-),score=80.25 PLAT9775.1:159-659(-)
MQLLLHYTHAAAASFSPLHSLFCGQQASLLAAGAASTSFSISRVVVVFLLAIGDRHAADRNARRFLQLARRWVAGHVQHDGQDGDSCVAACLCNDAELHAGVAACSNDLLLDDGQDFGQAVPVCAVRDRFQRANGAARRIQLQLRRQPREQHAALLRSWLRRLGRR